MKLTHAVLPVAALVAVLLWNLPPQRTLHALETSSQSLRGQLAAARLSPTREIREKRQPRAADTEVARERKPIDWNYLAAQARLFEKGEPVDDDGLDDLTERLAEMTREQLLVARKL